MSRLRLAALLALACLSGRLGAAEKASPALQRERQTSTSREISVKPLFAYSARGRRDPFSFDISLNGSSKAQGRDFSIAELKLVGFMGNEQGKTALFFNPFRKVSYRFRGGHLYSPEGAAIANIKGAFLSDRQLSLTQGESNMIFQLRSNSKLRSLEATIAHDRKELQR